MSKFDDEFEHAFSDEFHEPAAQTLSDSADIGAAPDNRFPNVDDVLDRLTLNIDAGATGSGEAV